MMAEKGKQTWKAVVLSGDHTLHGSVGRRWMCTGKRVSRIEQNDWQGRECVDAKQTIEENGICICLRQRRRAALHRMNDSYFVAI